MPDNHRKVLSDLLIDKLNATYYFEYDPTDNTVITKLYSCKKATKHDASASFHINAKRIGVKIVFSVEAISIWQQLQSNKASEKYTLFDVNNAINKLKTMYQKPDRYNVLNILKTNFSGIKRI